MSRINSIRGGMNGSLTDCQEKIRPHERRDETDEAEYKFDLGRKESTKRQL